MGCPIRIPLDHWLPAPPQSISPRGRVLLRPQAPRHPPYALHRGSLSALHHRAPLPPETGKIRVLQPGIPPQPVDLLTSTTPSGSTRRYVGIRSGRPDTPFTCQCTNAVTSFKYRAPSLCLGPRSSSLATRWWSRGDSNPGPPPCKGGALPTKLRPHSSS